MTECYFYDDGHGKGSYCSGMSCGQPKCNLSKKLITPECEGLFVKCELNKKEAISRIQLISCYQSNIKKLKQKI